MTMPDPTPAVLPDARALIDRLTHNIETQRVLVEQTAPASVEREAARLAYAVMRDARTMLLATPPSSDAAVPAGETHGKWHVMLLGLVNAMHGDGGVKTQAIGIQASYDQALALAAAPKVASEPIRNCFGIPDSHNGWTITQGPDDRFYASVEHSADTWEALEELLDDLPAPKVASDTNQENDCGVVDAGKRDSAGVSGAVPMDHGHGQHRGIASASDTQDTCPACNGCGFDNPQASTWPCNVCGGSGGVPKVASDAAMREAAGEPYDVLGWAKAMAARGGPHEWGYRDVATGEFIHDEWPFFAAEYIAALHPSPSGASDERRTALASMTAMDDEMGLPDEPVPLSPKATTPGGDLPEQAARVAQMTEAEARDMLEYDADTVIATMRDWGYIRAIAPALDGESRA
jgi:hypothetical protein